MFILPGTDTDTDTDAIGLQTHFVGVGDGVGIGVGVGQCEHTMSIVSVGENNRVFHSFYKCGRSDTSANVVHMSYFAYACRSEGKNDISRLISETA